MRGILFVVALGAGCEAKTTTPPNRDAPKLSAGPAMRAPAPPRLPAPAASRPNKLSQDTFLSSFAEASNTIDGWNAVAASLEHDLARCTTDCEEIAWARVLAFQNALALEPNQRPGVDEVVPALPPRVQAVVDALDQFVALADPTNPEVPGVKFLAASANYRWRQQDEAIARLEVILREHRDLEIAEYAANQLLDSLLQAGRLAELRAWATELLADTKFLAGKDELRQTLERVRALAAAAGTP